MSDDELMLRVAGNDETAFRVLYSRWAPRVMSYAARTLVGDRQEAEDVVQESFLNLYGARKRYRAEGRFGAFLFRIAGNQVRSRFRSRPPEPLEDLEERLEVPGHGSSTEARLDLESALALLPFDQRDALLLAVLGGMKYREIGGLAGCSEDTVAKRISRARSRLRAILSDEEAEPEPSTGDQERRGVRHD